MKIIICILLLSIVACNSMPSNSSRSEQEKKKTLPAAMPLKKGKFLDYIYQILPSHKQPDYGINSAKLNNGYAFGEGPYDGYLFEFFLFRGIQSDLVLFQASGYEVEAESKGDVAEKVFGIIVEAYFFPDGKMTKTDFKNLIPFARIEKLYADSFDRISVLEEYKAYKTGVGYWRHYKYLKLPIIGTSIQLLACKDEPELPFVIKTRCAVVGSLNWNKQKQVFDLKSAKTIEIVDVEL